LRKSLWIGALAIALLTLAAHLPGLRHQFVLWDDTTHITQNPVIRALTWANITAMFTQPIAKLYCPLTWLSFAVDHQIWGQNPFGYHLTNILLHVANTVLVFLLIGQIGKSAPPLAPFFTALLFGIHPLRVESVAWATERKDVLFVFFYLLALLVYLRRDKLWLCFLLFVAATLAKSAAVTFPVVALLLDRFLVTNGGASVPASGAPAPASGGRSAHPLRSLLPFFAVSILIGTVTVWAQASGIGETVAGAEAIPLFLRPALVGYCALFYLGKFLWPLNLSAIYPSFDELHWYPILSGLGFLAVTAGAWWLRRRAPVVLAGWLFYLVTLAPTIGLMPVGIHVVADRYSYLPLLGLCFVTGYAASHHRVAAVVLSIIVAGLMTLTVLRTRVWANTETLFLSVLDDNPRSLPALINLTKWHTDLDEFDRAIEYGERALAIAPHGEPGRRNLAAALKQAGRLEEAVRVWPQIVASPPAAGH